MKGWQDMKQRRELSLREKLGQRFVVGFPGTVLTKEFLDFLAEYKIGNVILFAHNVENNEQLKKLCGQIREEIIKNTGIPPFITIDQEGGMVVRLSDEAVNVPGAMAIAATEKKKMHTLPEKLPEWS